jgi:hypothetical protein
MGEASPTSVHHRRPTSIGGTNQKRNLRRVLVTQHQAWHTLFHNYEADVIARIINTTWLDPDFEFIVRKRK